MKVLRVKTGILPSVAEPTFRLSTANLRREISARNLLLAQGIAHESTFGAVPSVLYQEAGGEQGNFLPAAYRRIRASPDLEPATEEVLHVQQKDRPLRRSHSSRTRLRQ